MNYNKLIAENIKMLKKYPNFPKLPKIVKEGENNRLNIVEINTGHTQSVFRGYLKRVQNFKNTLALISSNDSKPLK